jgi:hypothetical protein
MFIGYGPSRVLKPFTLTNQDYKIQTVETRSGREEGQSNNVDNRTMRMVQDDDGDAAGDFDNCATSSTS